MTNLVKKGKYADILQFALVLLSDLLIDVQGFAQAILSQDIINPLLTFYLPLNIHWQYSLLKHEDEAVPILSAQVITFLLLNGSPATEISDSALTAYFNWLCTLCQKPHISMQDLAMQYFAGALRISRNRLLFWKPELKCSEEVVKILKTKKDLQLQYHTLLILWLITFETKIARELNKYTFKARKWADWRKHDIIPILMEISKTAVKEKINRLVIGIFRVTTPRKDLTFYRTSSRMHQTRISPQW